VLVYIVPMSSKDTGNPTVAISYTNLIMRVASSLHFLASSELKSL